MFGLLTDAVTLVFSTLLPTFLTYKALSLPASQQTGSALHPWLTYWITNSLLLSFPRIVPFDSYLRLAAHIYLLVPGRAESIYQSYLRPWLEEHEAQIEDGITRAHDRGKEQFWEYLRSARELVIGTVLGSESLKQRKAQEEAQMRAEAERKAQGGSYVQSLLARWSSESRAQESMADAKNAGGREPTLATKLGSFVSAAASVGLEHAQNAASSARGAAQPGDGSHTASSASRISEGLASLTAGLSDMKKSRSETDFEKIEPEDAPSAETLPGKQHRKNPSGNWSGWLWADKTGGSNTRSDAKESSATSSAIDTSAS